MARILVTGGAGYIGSHAAKVLARSGFEPIVFDNLSAGHRWAVKWGPLIEGDLADTTHVESVLKDYNVEGVVHFAANAYVGESMTNPRKYFRNNVKNTLNLLDAMLEAKVEHVVFSSTCATYGDPAEVPMSESHPQAPVNPYGESKLFVERVLHWYQQAYGLNSVCLRYFNAAGADPEAEIGEVHDPETHLIPLTIMAAMELAPPLKIFGTDYPTADGTAIRDYVHVMDLAAAHVKALNHLRDGGPSVALNLGTGKGSSVREVIREVERAGECTVPTEESPRRPGDPPSLIADARAAGDVLGWSPQYPGIGSIVESAWAWQKVGHPTA